MLTITLLIMRFIFRRNTTPVIEGHTSNSSLSTVREGYPGTPLDQNGLFINEEFPTIISVRALLKFMFQRNPQREFKANDKWRIGVLEGDSWLEDSRDKIVWLGHATFYIQLAGKRIVIDPVFGKLPVGKRYSALPVDPAKLLNIDYILISHAHYDHCDKQSIRLLTSNNPQAQLLTGLNLEKLLSKWADNPTQAAGWYQQYDLEGDLKITFLPSRHWANRSLFDVNTTLWGGFMIQSADRCIYYGGDSGYDGHFREIGKLFPGIDVALIGAGAYSPGWFMSPHHQDPYHAAEAFKDTGAKVFIPFHYGTFDSADEPLGEPEEILRKLKKEGKIEQELRILKLGEVYMV